MGTRFHLRSTLKNTGTVWGPTINSSHWQAHLLRGVVLVGEAQKRCGSPSEELSQAAHKFSSSQAQGSVYSQHVTTAISTPQPSLSTRPSARLYSLAPHTHTTRGGNHSQQQSHSLNRRLWLNKRNLQPSVYLASTSVPEIINSHPTVCHAAVILTYVLNVFV